MHLKSDSILSELKYLSLKNFLEMEYLIIKYYSEYEVFNISLFFRVYSIYYLNTFPKLPSIDVIYSLLFI